MGDRVDTIKVKAPAAEFSAGSSVIIKEYGLPAIVLGSRLSTRGNYHIYKVRLDVSDLIWERFYKADQLERG